MEEQKSSDRLYWLKLKKDFFKRHDVKVIENMENGKDYVLFYLKLLCESLDHNGNLRFSDTIPYNENMLSAITGTNIDVVRSAMKIFISLNLIEVCEDKTIYMREVEKMAGSESKWAEIKRLQRAEIGQCPKPVQQMSTELVDKWVDSEQREKEAKREIRDKEIKSIYNVGQPDGKRSFLSEIKEIVDYLNSKLGTHYKYNAKDTQSHIKARLNEGFTVDDFKKVIDKKSAEWLKSPEMAKFLRPQTLFSLKFESYLNELTVNNSGTTKNGWLGAAAGEIDYGED